VCKESLIKNPDFHNAITVLGNVIFAVTLVPLCFSKMQSVVSLYIFPILDCFLYHAGLLQTYHSVY